MPGPAVLTLVGIGLLVAAIAVYLIRVALILRHVVLKLETILNGVVDVSRQSAPIGEVANAINADLGDLRKQLDGLAARAKVSADAQAEPGPQSSGLFGRMRGS